jgi:hypothetical protein
MLNGLNPAAVEPQGRREVRVHHVFGPGWDQRPVRLDGAEHDSSIRRRWSERDFGGLAGMKPDPFNRYRPLDGDL